MRHVRPFLLASIVLGLLGPAAAEAQVCAPAQECGDVNESDDVTVADALAVLRRSLGLPMELACSCSGGEECPAGGVTQTLQTKCWDPLDTVAPINPIDCPGTGQDGDLQTGLVPEFVDNGDGTISDLRTTLMWEKLTNDQDPRHDYDNYSYLWEGAFQKIETLNDEAFAGHTDWRVPNAKELATLVDYSRNLPAIHPIFNSGCASGCTVDQCSCTISNDYWSSTTNQPSPTLAWYVDFRTGMVTPNGAKSQYKYVRAVRGGY